VIDHLTKMRARRAAQDYMAGVKIRTQANELSPTRLAAKFEVSAHSIMRAIDNMPAEALTNEESVLVRQCYSEHKALATQAERLSITALAKHHRVTAADIQVELDLAGYVSPFRSGRKAVTA